MLSGITDDILLHFQTLVYPQKVIFLTISDKVLTFLDLRKKIRIIIEPFQEP